MSKLDLAPHENTLNTSLATSHETFLKQNNQAGLKNANLMDLDLEAMMEIFEEDAVKVEGCK